MFLWKILNNNNINNNVLKDELQNVELVSLKSNSYYS